ncbi:protein PET117 homolog, mitochondrial [Anopheles moucheti]|uniref:protein PET117 homolog, mitochondrial n=1 Tax=Anopheles moucheti TaxID=186751 RepID=UPI0022F0534F|nr:protein PET117 homolog, mitochondrial [Anopheles moucheti]
MSTAAKLTFISACIASGSLIAYVHYSQAADRERLHEGVRRDVERQRLKHLVAGAENGPIANNDSGPRSSGTLAS